MSNTFAREKRHSSEDVRRRAMKVGLTIVVIIVGLGAFAWYSLSPDGLLGYDEGVRLVDRTQRAADQLKSSSAQDSQFTYTPKYGADQSYAVEFTEGDYCPNPGPGCSGTTVVVHVAKGKSGAGYALGRSAAVPHRLSVKKANGSIHVHLHRVGETVQVVALE